MGILDAPGLTKAQGDIVIAQATTQANSAASSATASQTAQTASESARDAALATGKVYANTTAGLAATTSGQYFNVVSASAIGCFDLYLNSSGSAVLQRTYPSSSVDSQTLNSGKNFPLKAITRDTILSSSRSDVNNGILSVTVIGARPGKLYRLRWYGNGATVSSAINYEMLFYEYDAATYATNSASGEVGIVQLGDIPATSIDTSQNIITRVFNSTRVSGLSFIVTYDRTKFTTGSSVDMGTSSASAGWSWIIDPSNYIPAQAAPAPFGDLVYSWSAGVLSMAFRATAARDAKLTFKAAGPNSIYDLTNYDYANNSGTPPTLSRGWTSVWSGATDTVGPYYVSADANGDASPTQKFTGGAHDNGSGSPSANVKSIAIYADGAQLVDGATGSAREISIIQVVGVQGWNTTGSAREILTETRSVTFDRWGMRVALGITAKENVHIQRYYGAQVVGIGFNQSVHFVNGIPTVGGVAQPQGRYSIGAGAEVDSGAYTTYPGVNTIALRGVWGDLTCSLDTSYGLGAARVLDAGQPSAKWSTSSGNKAYWQLIYMVNPTPSNGLALTTGQVARWRAAYTWGDKLSASANVDATIRYRDKGKARMRAIFTAAGAGQISMLPSDCNRSLSVVGGTAAGTADAISGADSTTATATGYGDMEFTID